METKEEINNRISGVTKVKEHSIINFFNWIFIILAIGIGILTYFKVDENGSFIYQIFHVKVSFVSINNKIDLFFDRLFKRDNSNENIKTVEYQDLYISLGENKFQTIDGQIRSLGNGEISYYKYNEKYEYFVVVNYEDNLLGLYSKVSKPVIEINKSFEENTVLFDYSSDFFECVFRKNNENLTYAEVVK